MFFVASTQQAKPTQTYLPYVIQRLSTRIDRPKETLQSASNRILKPKDVFKATMTMSNWTKQKTSYVRSLRSV